MASGTTKNQALDPNVEAAARASKNSAIARREVQAERRKQGLPPTPRLDSAALLALTSFVDKIGAHRVPVR